MEIIHAFGIDWKLITIQAINFAVVLFVLHRYAYGPIMKLLEKREALIKEGVKNAEDAERIKSAIEEEKVVILKHAREEGGKIVEDLHKQGIVEGKKIVHDAQEKTIAMLAEARTQGEEERAYILRESEKEVARTAVLAAEKILRSSAHPA